MTNFVLFIIGKTPEESSLDIFTSLEDAQGAVTEYVADKLGVSNHDRCTLDGNDIDDWFETNGSTFVIVPREVNPMRLTGIADFGLDADFSGA